MKNMKNKLFVTLGILGMSLLSYAGTKHSLETSYTRVRDKDCVKNRVKRAKIVRFTLC